MVNIAERLDKVEELSKSSKNKEQIKEICDSLREEVKEVKTRGDPIVEMY